MSQLTDLMNTMKGIADRASKRPFPYEDIRKMKADLAHDPRVTKVLSSFNADFNEHLMMVLGLASGGIKSVLMDRRKRTSVKRLLEKSFWDRYPQYQFLRDANLPKYPELLADLSVIEKLRLMLIKVIIQDEKKAGRVKPKVNPPGTTKVTGYVAAAGLARSLFGLGFFERISRWLARSSRASAEIKLNIEIKRRAHKHGKHSHKS